MNAIDLRSDTVTKPTPEMRRAMADAEVGDDVYGEDPSINRLQELGAEMVGKEAALFVPSGTMGNQVCVMAHTERGQEIILENEAHIYVYEAGGPSVLAGCQTRRVPGENGVMDPDDVRDAIRGENIHFPRTGLLCLENTHNRAGGTVTSVEQMEALSEAAHEGSASVHLDGARVFNAAAALDVDVKQLTAPVDSVQFCLSKGLAAPVGSLVAGSKEFIEECLRARKLLGGGMRQAGIIAAAGIVALDNMVDRLCEDHARASKLAENICQMDPFFVDLESVQSNIVAFDIDPNFCSAHEFTSEINNRGVLANPVTDQRVRMVTHYEIGDKDIDDAIDIMAEVVSQW